MITSRYEGFSMVALGALALRVPVVAVESEGACLKPWGMAVSVSLPLARPRL